ncbi:Endolytic peptidoglycan transglycosylase RlpA [Cupriavidus necator]|uniref:Endolytic peptidoglycan transglycosylase RlpA n=1 Tax=Cupriavidus necator (strain ATCC 17699 / DSM 428 / KCTC 22496 / NCIMB 10442 / H16 / Stanier 337) TaxID=381666 RepID=Q0K5T2_CUPNH|nr:septal ring lytic transglycosylase RlpA family protein [Cupriavidus necator]QQB78212.1 septal ring lytic transglycosylase RlpA family protein [Cupriavidus necator]WKA40788.1 septal ring lytic transglycosylase RlpA family protein [Cupriavidus necator]CAJ94639.1 rare lipoprotein A [Cupriavidus necator H16]
MLRISALVKRWQRLAKLGACTACAVVLAACATPPEGDNASNDNAGAVPTRAAKNGKAGKTDRTDADNKSARASGGGSWNLFGYDADDGRSGSSLDGLRADIGTFEQRGVSSWYGKGFHGRKTANGERFDMRAMTAAHPTLPLDSWVLVRNLRNNKVAVLRINDRGPYHGNRVLDVSYGAARRLGFVERGATNVEIRRLTRTEVAALGPQIDAGGTEAGDGSGDDDVSVPELANSLAPAKARKSTKAGGKTVKRTRR